MKCLVVASGLALGLFGLTDTASAQVIVSPGYGYGGGYYARPAYPAYGYGGYAPHHHHHHQNYNYYPRSSLNFSYGYPGYSSGYGYRPWGYPGYGGYGYGYRPGVSFGLTIIR